MPRGVPSYVQSAALTLGAATSDRIDVSSDLLAGMTTFTVLKWFVVTTLVGAKRIFETGTSASVVRKRMTTGASGVISMLVNRATTNADYDSATGVIVANQMNCLMWTYNENATPTCVLAMGTPVTPLAALSLTQNALGSGGTNTEGAGGIYRIGNSSAASPASALTGRFAVSAIFNRVLTLAEGITWQFSALDKPFPSIMAGCRGLWYPGKEGASKVLDYSGYGITGTVTGATLSRGVTLLTQDAVRDRRVMRSIVSTSKFPYLLFA